VLTHALRDLPATDFAAANSPERKAWIAALPSLVRDIARQWDLTSVGEEIRNGYNAVVLPVCRARWRQRPGGPPSSTAGIIGIFVGGGVGRTWVRGQSCELTGSSDYPYRYVFPAR
jgi:hypothetical protein